MGFSVSQYLVALSMFVLLIDRKRSVGLAILAGISTATISYGYAWDPIASSLINTVGNRLFQEN